MIKTAALIDRLLHPKWMIPDARLDTVPTLADMKEAAELLKRIEKVLHAV